MARRVRYEFDTSDVDRELNRLGGGPDTGLVLRLEAVLTAQFQATQQFVHVVTGSLRNSGRADSRIRRGAWRGSISYGGPSAGFPHNPVRYAAIEQARSGGRQVHHGAFSGQVTSHNFMLPAEAFEHRYEEAIRDWLAGET